MSHTTIPGGHWFRPGFWQREWRALSDRVGLGRFRAPWKLTGRELAVHTVFFMLNYALIAVVGRPVIAWLSARAGNESTFAEFDQSLATESGRHASDGGQRVERSVAHVLALPAAWAPSPDISEVSPTL